jgi:putative Holliday junction resolvase
MPDDAWMSRQVRDAEAMPITPLPSLRAALPRHARLIGLDPGSKTIGIALSDVLLMLATPYAGLPRAKLAANAAEIRRIAEKEGAAGLVCGLPLGMDGSFGPAAQAAKDWAMAVSDATGLPVALWDERLSSSAVNRMMIEADLTRAKRAKAVDAAAAAYMLQAALDATRSVTDQPGGFSM